MTHAEPTLLAAPAEAWAWWGAVVALGILTALVLMWLRRWLLRPMRHTPGDTTDAWAEAGRRLRPSDEAAEDTRTGGNGDSA